MCRRAQNPFNAIAWSWAAAALALTLGCGEGERRPISLWHQMRPGDRAVLDRRIKDFEQANPGVRVQAVYKETEELRSGLESAVLVGRGPDVVYGPSDPLGVYQEIGALQDLTPWFDSETRSDFDGRALIDLPSAAGGDSQLVMVGDRFGNHLALIYDRNRIDTPPRTIAELLRLAAENTVDTNGNGRPDRYGLVWNYTEPFFVIPFVTGFGGWVFDEGQGDGSLAPSLDTPQVARALGFVSGLRNEQRVLPESADYEAASSLFLSGKAAMLIDGDWSWQRYLSSRQIDAAVTPLPIVGETGLPMAPMVAPKGYSMSVAAEGERRELAASLIRFLTSEETQRIFLEEKRIYPARLSARKSPLLETDPTLAASIEQIERGRPMPTATEMRAIWDAMRPPYQELMAGKASPEAAVEEMQRLAEKKIATLTRTVSPGPEAPYLRWIGLAAVIAVLVSQRRGLAEWRRDIRVNSLAYKMAGPAVLLVLLTVAFPLVFNVILSFSNMSLKSFHDWRIVGAHNYTSLFLGGQSDRFWIVFQKTIAWTVVNVSLHVAIGLLLAVALHGPVRGKGAYRVALIIPWAVPAYITALTWRGMFDKEFGSVNQAFAMLGLPAVNWLTDEANAFLACIITNVWLGFPFMMMVAIGGLQGIPKEMYEAARLDGAGKWDQFCHVTLPMLRPVLLPAATLGAVWTFNNLNVVWLVSNGGEPADRTHILVSYVYKSVFNLYQYGQGAALSMVIFAMLLAFSVLVLGKTGAMAKAA